MNVLCSQIYTDQLRVGKSSWLNFGCLCSSFNTYLYFFFLSPCLSLWSGESSSSESTALRMNMLGGFSSEYLLPLPYDPFVPLFLLYSCFNFFILEVPSLIS